MRRDRPRGPARFAPPAGVNRPLRGSPAAATVFNPRLHVATPLNFPWPPQSRQLLDSRRSPSLHPLEKFLVRPYLSPPSRCSTGSAPTSCRALGSRARAGVPGGCACSWPRPRPRGWPWAGTAGSLSPSRERLSNSRPRRHGTWAASRAVCAGPAGRRPPLGECPSALSSPSASAARRVAVPRFILRPSPTGDTRLAPFGVWTPGGRDGLGAALASPGATFPAPGWSAGGSCKETFSVLLPPPRKQKERTRRVAPRGSVCNPGSPLEAVDHPFPCVFGRSGLVLALDCGLLF